jgi:hypothetical protein
MRLHLPTSILIVSIAGISIAGDRSNAQETQFFCGSWEGTPATMARTSSGEIPVIRWVDDSWGAEYTPQTRCELVSEKFQKYHSEGTLKYMTTGRENGQNVVCVAQTEDGSCQGRSLFTLKPDANPGQTLERLMNVRNRSGGPIDQSSKRIYINMDEYLKDASASSSPNNPTDTNRLQPESEGTSTPATLW